MKRPIKHHWLGQPLLDQLPNNFYHFKHHLLLYATEMNKPKVFLAAKFLHAYVNFVLYKNSILTSKWITKRNLEALLVWIYNLLFRIKIIMEVILFRRKRTDIRASKTHTEVKFSFKEKDIMRK